MTPRGERGEALPHRSVRRVAPIGKARVRVAAALLAASVWLWGAACGGAADPPASPSPEPGGPTLAARKRLEVLASHPHDRGAFTQGLLVHDGVLFESTGLNGRSTLREVERETGRVLRSVALPREHFGEGLALVDDRLVLLTWKSGVARIYDRATFELIGEWRYAGEGWGLCHDGERFVMTNGSSRLAFRDEDTFAETGGVDVTLDGRPLDRLNEIECVGGRVYANVWQTESIAEIDPATGVVTAWIDASGILSPDERAGANVMNGIAWDEARQSFYVTGKLWPRLFEVRIVDP